MSRLTARLKHPGANLRSAGTAWLDTVRQQSPMFQLSEGAWKNILHHPIMTSFADWLLLPAYRWSLLFRLCKNE